ncbi:putative Glycosyl transferase family 2 [Candidatus Competibacter denitrificans Run_A_D11]|uniref:Glycosyl transferase family 2 n=1 Tax=Candidatus Competibacter denitrificans Run_A_D11 TaxID=1400863 RepID=W6M154_9GAMM|nr:glycosyltransferase [Candidatus Competibacter denitrificans]CDI01142.1 putative Glycosyl transferase family 2 [Candidatus Competibacter denitrificans Run_A_D11]
MALVSVIIPAYNAAQYIRDTIDSVLNQSYSNFEIIVVNDGSTDETAQILNEYGDKLRVVHQNNKGSAAACNYGAALAQGEWIAFLDADDIWLPDKLMLQLKHCKDSSISHTDSFCFGESISGEVQRGSITHLVEGQVLKQLLVTNFISKSTVMIQRAIFNQYKGFDETYLSVEDWPFWLRVCANHSLGYLPEPVVRYRVHRQSATMKTRRTLPDHLRIISEAFNNGGVGQSFPELRRQALVSSYQINCHYAAEAGDWTFALYCALRALRFEPTAIRTWKNLAKSTLIPLGIPY